jgi:hypothetical protein
VSIFLVTVHRSGPLWDPTLSLEQQSEWDAHANFMDELVDQGFVILGGPLSDDVRVVLVIESTSPDMVRDVLSHDPWSGSHLQVHSIEPWALRLDGRAS